MADRKLSPVVKIDGDYYEVEAKRAEVAEKVAGTLTISVKQGDNAATEVADFDGSTNKSIVIPITVDSAISSTSSNPVQNKAIHTALGNKVDKSSGKGLSTNDYTTEEKTKLAGITAGAEVNVQSDWGETSTSSDAFIKNKPTFKTINGTSILGSGDITIAGGGGTGNGDMLKSVYVTGNGTNINKVDKAINAEQLDGKAASSYALRSELFNINYNDLTNKPTIPTVNNATLTIKKNGTNVATFTANSASDITADISVPTITDNLTSNSTTAALSANQGRILNEAISSFKKITISQSDPPEDGATGDIWFKYY